MPGLNMGNTYSPEAAQPVPDIGQVPGAEAAAAAAVPEMPASHPEFDPKTLTVDGLIKACPYYAKLAETNPDIVKTEATEMVQRVQEREAMRDSGMSDAAIKKQQWSLMRERHNAKTKAAEQASPEHVAQKDKPEPTIAQTTPAQELIIAKTSVPDEARLVTPPPIEAQRDIAPIVTKLEMPPTATTPTAAKHAETSALIDTARQHEQLTAAVTQSKVSVLEREEHQSPDTVTPTLATTAHNPSQVRSEADREGSRGEDLSVVAGKATEVSESEREITDGIPEISAVAIPEAAKQDAGEEPATVTLERFTTTLKTLTREASPESPESPDAPPALEAPVVAVVIEVKDKLAKLDLKQQEEALLIVPNIAESLQTIKHLQHEAAAPKDIVTAVEKMREQIVQLFKAINIEPDDEKIEYFIQAMLAPNFAFYKQTPLTPEELAKMGTREVKLASQFTALLTQTATEEEMSVGQRLGQVILAFIHPTFRLELKASPFE